MANLEVIALNTATPQLLAPQSGDGYAMPRPVTVTEVVGSTALTLTGATQTAALPVLNATQTWNNAATTFTAVKLNVTDTASSANSLLTSFQVNGINLLGVRRASISGTKYDRTVLVFPQYTYTQGLVGGFFAFGETESNPNFVINFGNAASIDLQAGSALRWSDSASNASSGTKDVSIFRDAANTLAQRNGTNAQTFRVYNTYTDASNYERGFLRWASNLLEIGMEKLGTGSNREIKVIAPVAVKASSGTNAADIFYATNLEFSLAQAIHFRWGAATNAGTGHDIGLNRLSAGVLKVTNGSSGSGAIEASTVRTATAYTVATLPAAGTAGQRAYVTDALAPTFLGTLTGGGAVVCPVFDNGTAWVAG